MDCLRPSVRWRTVMDCLRPSVRWRTVMDCLHPSGQPNWKSADGDNLLASGLARLRRGREIATETRVRLRDPPRRAVLGRRACVQAEMHADIAAPFGPARLHRRARSELYRRRAQSRRPACRPPFFFSPPPTLADRPRPKRPAAPPPSVPPAAPGVAVDAEERNE